MKIAVILATRGRPRQALGVIEAARLLACGEHEIRFTVACDHDDPADTERFFSGLWQAGITIDCAPRPAGVATCWNRCVPDDADLIVTLTDDAVLATANWDDVLAETFAAHPWAHPDLAMACLNDPANPGQATLFAFRPSWFKHCGLFDERFPFWYSDTAIAETYSFLTGRHIPFAPVTAVMRPGRFNPRLREMRLWWTLYACTRMERLKNAAKVRADLGLPEPPNLIEMVATWAFRDLRGLPQSEAIAASLPALEPDEAYLAARKAALVYIAENPLGSQHLEAA